MLTIFQDAIDNGDILEEDNTFWVIACVMPLVADGVLKTSSHMEAFMKRESTKLLAQLEATRKAEQEKRSRGPWWKFWGRGD